jgi:hypothetical protein
MKKLFYIVFPLMIMAVAACSKQRGMPESTYVDGEYGQLTLENVVDAPVNCVQGILVDYQLTRANNYNMAFDPAKEQVSYYAYLVLAAGDTVHFLENLDHKDSLAAFLAIKYGHTNLQEGKEQLFIPKYNLLLNPGSYSGKLKLEARVIPNALVIEKTYRPIGKSIFSGEVPIRFTQPPLTEYGICLTYCEVNSDLVDPYSYDWPAGRPDLFYKVTKPCVEHILFGDWENESQVHRRATEWTFPEDSLEFVLAQGDSAVFGVYDFDNFNKDDLIGEFRLDLNALANKGLKAVPDFGNIRKCSLSLKAQPFRQK